MQNNIKQLLHLLFIDIETIPQQKDYSLLSPEWQQLWYEKITKTVPENESVENNYKLRAGILAEFGKIICISVGFLYENKAQKVCLKVKNIFNDDETTLLNEFINTVNMFFRQHNHFEFAGHNIREFDIPYLCRRMIANQLPLPPYLQLNNLKPWEIKAVDTLQWWRFGDHKNYISLNLLANVLGVPSSKDDISGADVYRVYYEENNLLRIATYCGKDVAAVANIVLRFKGLQMVEEENILFT
jgi:uncharacterized protein YprB with RNaseH-like and TPR domain